MRLIDADAAADMLERMAKNYIGIGMPNAAMEYSGWANTMRNPMCFPTADVEPVVHGQWVIVEGFWCCNNCGCSPADWECKPNNPYGLPPYCHNCGSKMEKPSP